MGFSVGAAVRLVGGLLFGACALFIIAAFSIEGTDVPGIGVPGAQPGSPGVVRRARSALSRPWLAIPGRSPAPEVKPAGRACAAPRACRGRGDERVVV